MGSKRANEATTQLTDLLRRAKSGDSQAHARVFPLVVREIRRRVQKGLAHGRPDSIHSTSDIVNETYQRVMDDKSASWANRNAFFGHTTVVIKNLLIDLSRKRKALKRGQKNQKRDPLDSRALLDMDQPIDHLMLDELLTEFGRLFPRAAQILEFRHYGQHGVDEIAKATGVGPATVYRELRFAKAWLRRELDDDQRQRLERD